jgi:peptidoglycan/xylan/chitin deacetylase (PgdA/CDA1 family)
MTLLAVSFHYIAERPGAEPRAIFPVGVADFRRQLEELGRTFEFVSRDQLLAAVAGEGALPALGCLITFDDGLAEQFQHALPVLERLGVPGVFFVGGKPATERRPLHVHRVHHLRERLSPDQFDRLLDEHLRELGVSPPAVPPDRASRMYRYDDPPAACLKYLLNVALDVHTRERLIAAMFAAVVADEGAFCDELYMSRAQIDELERRHRALGSHGYDHRALGTLTASEVAVDVERGAAFVEQVTGSRPRIFSYPYGSADAVTPANAEEAARAGFRVGFTMERALNASLREPLLLARVDANDAPGGRQPLFRPEGDRIVVADGMAPTRRRYLDEPEDPATRTAPAGQVVA